MYEEIKCKNFQCWNTSLSMLFDKSPKIEIICGKCNHYFTRRFYTDEMKNDYPRTMCPCCKTVNWIPIRIN